MTEDYYEIHKACPLCGSRNLLETTVCCLGEVDKNKVSCLCGWEGIIHDLVPAKNTSRHGVSVDIVYQGKLCSEDCPFLQIDGSPAYCGFPRQETLLEMSWDTYPEFPSFRHKVCLKETGDA